MRHRPTRAEDRVWQWLRARRFDGCKFRRQFPIGRYILDFYCPQLKLAIELDGQQHSQPSEYESIRWLALRKLGIEVVRIENAQLIRDPVSAADAIHAAISRAREIPSR